MAGGRCTCDGHWTKARRAEIDVSNEEKETKKTIQNRTFYNKNKKTSRPKKMEGEKYSPGSNARLHSSFSQPLLKAWQSHTLDIRPDHLVYPLFVTDEVSNRALTHLHMCMVISNRRQVKRLI